MNLKDFQPHKKLLSGLLIQWTVPLPASRSLFLKPLAGRLLTLLRIPQTSLVPALSPSRRQDLSPARSPPSRRSLTLSTLRILETSGIGFMQNGDTINYLDGQMASLKVADGAPKLLIDMIVVGGGLSIPRARRRPHF